MTPHRKLRYNPLYSSANTQLLSQSLPTAPQLYELVNTFLSSHLGKSKTILIANSGGINDITVLKTSNPTWQLTLFQPDDTLNNQNESSAQLEVGKSSIKRLSSLLSDASNYQEYDGAFCDLLLHFLDDPGKLELLKSISSRLKPGSPFALVTLTGDHAEPEFERQLEAWKMNLNRSNESSLTKVDSDAEANQVRTLPLITQGKLGQLLDAAGFEQSTLFYATYFCRGWVSLKR